MRVHLEAKTNHGWRVGYCGLAHHYIQGPVRYIFTDDHNQTTCKTCLKAHAAWLRRKEDHIQDCTPEDPCAACERDKLRQIITNFQKAFLWIETSWLTLTPEEESALTALKDAGEWLEDSPLLVVVQAEKQVEEVSSE